MRSNELPGKQFPPIASGGQIWIDVTSQQRCRNRHDERGRGFGIGGARYFHREATTASFCVLGAAFISAAYSALARVDTLW